jgi:hypothetical protein
MCKRCGRELFGDKNATDKTCPFCRTPIYYDWAADELVLEANRPPVAPPSPRPPRQSTLRRRQESQEEPHQMIDVEDFVTLIRNLVPPAEMSTDAEDIMQVCISIIREDIGRIRTTCHNRQPPITRREVNLLARRNATYFEAAAKLMRVYDVRARATDYALQKMNETVEILVLLRVDLLFLRAKIRYVMMNRTEDECLVAFAQFAMNKIAEYKHLCVGTRTHLQRYQQARTLHLQDFTRLYRTNHGSAELESIYLRTEKHIVEAPPSDESIEARIEPLI